MNVAKFHRILCSWGKPALLQTMCFFHSPPVVPLKIDFSTYDFKGIVLYTNGMFFFNIGTLLFLKKESLFIICGGFDAGFTG